MDPNENTQAEIYANIRDKALEEAAKVCDALQVLDDTAEDYKTVYTPNDCAEEIRALKRNPNG